MKNGEQLSATDNGPVDAALAEYLLRRERGESVDLSELIANYPGCEVELRKFVAQERNVNRVMAVSSQTAMPSQDLAGRTLGDFRLRRIIGRGGMGIVWEAEQVSLGRKVAVKLLPGALCSDPRHRTRFQNEARILAQLEHPNIVNVIAVGEEADTYYFAMQYIDGITADELIRICAENPSPSPSPKWGGEQNEPSPERGGEIEWFAGITQQRERYRQCARIASEIADGLAHAHACGVLHRDVKPSNILLDKNGAARLTDFGLARMYGDATLTATGAILGTLRYASPEQLSGTSASVDERSDVYSLGATLWELVTGKRLFATEDRNSVITHVLKVDAPRPSSLAAGLPRDLETIITRAMAKVPADRYASAQTFADDLRRFLEGRPIQAKPISLGERAFRWANRNRGLATASVGSLIVLAAVSLIASGLVLQANSRTATALVASRDSESEARDSAADAEASERKTRELLYAADMALAGAAWHKNEPAQVRMLLDRYATPNRPGDRSTEEDPRGLEWYFLDRQTRPQSELLFQNDKALYLVDLMPGGKEFFTAGQDSVVRWHDSATGKVLRSLDTRQQEINCVSYNPSGTIFATAGDDGSVRIWNAADRSLRHSIAAYDGICFVAKFINDEMVITAARSAVHRLYSAESGALIREFTSPDARLAQSTSHGSLDAQVSQSGERFWTIEHEPDGQYEGVYEWNVATGQSRSISKERGIIHVATDSTEKLLFTNKANGEMRILDRESGNERQSWRMENKLKALAVSPDDRCLVVGDFTGQVFVWQLDPTVSSGRIADAIPETFSIHSGAVSGVVFAPDGESLFSVGREGTVRKTRIKARIEPFRELVALRKHTCVPVPGTKLVLIYANTPIRIVEPASGKIIKQLTSSHYPIATVSSDGTLIAAASREHVRVWNVESGRVVCTAKQKRRWTQGLDFSPDNSQLAVYSYVEEDKNQRIDVVEVATGKTQLFSPPGTVANWAYFCSGGLVAYLTTPRQIVCWNVPDKTVRWETEQLEVYPDVSAISPDRQTLLIAERKVLALFDCTTGEIRYRVPCKHPVTRLLFARDGRSFVVGGEQGQLSVWRADSGQFLFEIANIGPAIDSIQPLQRGFLASTRRIGQTVWLEF